MIFFILGCARSLLPCRLLLQLQRVGLPLLLSLGLGGCGSGLRSTGAAVVALGPCCSAARGVFLGEGLSPRLVHWQVNPLPPALTGEFFMSHQGSLKNYISMARTLITCKHSKFPYLFRFLLFSAEMQHNFHLICFPVLYVL